MTLQKLADPESIVNDIQKEIILLSIDLSNKIGELAGILQKQIRHNTQLDISISQDSSITNLEQQISSSSIENKLSKMHYGKRALISLKILFIEVQ